jgi:hypothetical protein
MSVKPAYWLWPLFWLLWATPVFATVSRIHVISVGSLGADSSDVAPSAVWLYWYDNATLTLDSAQMSPVDSDSLRWYRVIQPPVEGWNSQIAPGAWAEWTWADGSIDRDNALGIVPWTIHATDSVVTYSPASANFDTADASFIADTVDARLTAAHGSGAWTSGGGGSGGDTVTMYVLNSADSSPVAGLAVWMYPNDGGVALKVNSDPNGIAYFGYTAPDTFLAYSWGTGWNPDSVPFYVYAASAFADSMYVTQTTAASPSAPGLTPVTFNFYDGTGDSVKNVVLQYRLDAGGNAVAYHYDTTKIFDPAKVFEARTNASGQVTVNVVPNDSIWVRGQQTSKTRWIFKAFSPVDGKPLLGGPDGVKLTIPASATGLTYPKDFTGE